MAYENKKKQLFECLDAAERNLQGSCLQQREEDIRNARRNLRDSERDRSTERYKKKDSIFKQPELPINKCLRARQRPDHEVSVKLNFNFSLEHFLVLQIDGAPSLFQIITVTCTFQKNPQKYVKYSLAEITDTSDRMNTSAAFSFLREMEDRRGGDLQSNESSEPQKIVFKNSTKLRPKRDDDNESEKKEKIIGNKFVMKEYVIGEKRPKADKKTPKASSSSSAKAKQLKLSHLDDDEEEEEEED
jgi:hypothetical protein